VRVLLDTTYSRLAPYSGTAVYTQMLCAELARLGGIDVLQVHNRRRRRPAGGGAGSIRNLLNDRWWTGHELPRLARTTGADVIHHPLPAHVRRSGTPQVVTVMDLAFERLPECFDRGFRIYAGRTHRAAALRADAVVCPSETTAADARDLWRLDPERIVVAPLGPGQLAAAEKGEPTHFLYVGDDEPRKNLGTLIDAYALYRASAPRPLPLVLAGSASAAGPGIEIRRHPGPGELARLYGTAVALVHPSLYEGFGLTPLEAMTAAVPVIAARTPGITEICEDAVRYADARDPASFARAMSEISEDPELQNNLIERGRHRALRFSWSRCARAHVDAYSLALERA
jgi:glycosyltransferase involved in cell wall biosynthesis